MQNYSRLLWTLKTKWLKVNESLATWEALTELMLFRPTLIFHRLHFGSWNWHLVLTSAYLMTAMKPATYPTVLNISTKKSIKFSGTSFQVGVHRIAALTWSLTSTLLKPGSNNFRRMGHIETAAANSYLLLHWSPCHTDFFGVVILHGIIPGSPCDSTGWIGPDLIARDQSHREGAVLCTAQMHTCIYAQGTRQKMVSAVCVD